MKTLSVDAVAQIEGRRPIIAGAMRAVFPSGTYAFWSGLGDITLDATTFKGIGARALITPISSQIGGAADALKITLSQLDPDVAQSIEAEDYAQKPVTIWRLVFAPDKFTLLDSMVFMRGKIDYVTIREQVGGTAALDFAIEGPRRDMNRSGGRIRSDSDQRVLGGAIDGAMRHITVAGEKTLRWGQKEASASTLNGGILGIIKNRLEQMTA